MRLKLRFILFGLGLAAAGRAATFTVQVAPAGSLVFSPTSQTIGVGDRHPRARRGPGGTGPFAADPDYSGGPPRHRCPVLAPSALTAALSRSLGLAYPRRPVGP